jgi:hypothetical protein
MQQRFTALFAFSANPPLAPPYSIDTASNAILNSSSQSSKSTPHYLHKQCDQFNSTRFFASENRLLQFTFLVLS